MGNRLFLAVTIPGDVKESIARWVASVRAPGDGWRWVRPTNLHLTLRFYGETGEQVHEALVESVARLAKTEQPTEIRLEGWGAFPGSSRPRVLWIGLGGDVDTLARLAGRAEEEAVRLGFEPERRPFRPHLTVARAERRGGRPRLPQDETRGELRPGAVPVDRIVLYRSHLGPGGPAYEEVLEAPLGPGDSGTSGP